MPITVSHAKSNTIGDMTGTVTVFNSSGGTGTVLATDLVRPVDWNSAHNYTLALTGSEIASLFSFTNGITNSTNASGMTVGLDAVPFYEPFRLPNTNSTLSSPGIGTWYLDGPYVVPFKLGSGQFKCLVSNAAGFLNGAVYSCASTGSVTKYQTFYNQLALYKQGSGLSTSRLESVWTGVASILATQNIRLSTTSTNAGTVSNYLTLSFGSQFDSAGAYTYGSTSQSGSSTFGTSTAASTYANNLITGAVAYVSGARMEIIPFASTLAPGVYWMAHMFTSTSSTTGTNYGAGTLFSTHSRLGLLENNFGAYKRLGVSISNATTLIQPYKGYLATTTSNATSIINTGDMRATTGDMYWNYGVSTW